MNLMKVAKIAHEINRAFCAAIGDPVQPAWENAPEEMRQSTLRGVRHVIGHPDVSPEEQHRQWMDDKIAAGWKYGPTRDEAAKTHPCLVPYSELPLAQKVKDHLFVAAVRAAVE